MTTASRTIEEAALDSIWDHPRNLRREIGDVGELAESMKTFGVHRPGPGPGRGGRRRPDRGAPAQGSARKAGLATIPAEIRRDLDSEAKQMLAKLVENKRRRDLSPIEEAHGYQQVLDLGEFTAAKIGKAIGVSTARVRGRVALTCLAEEVQDKIHSAQITLTEAETLAEFADDAIAIKSLLRDVGSYNFKFTVEQERPGESNGGRTGQARLRKGRGSASSRGRTDSPGPAKSSRSRTSSTPRPSPWTVSRSASRQSPTRRAARITR